MKNGVFWYATPCGSCKSRRFGGMERLHHHGGKNQRARTTLVLAATEVRCEKIITSVLRLLVSGSVVPSSPILFTLMREVIRSSEIFQRH
jgi:hypothetical protein